MRSWFSIKLADAIAPLLFHSSHSESHRDNATTHIFLNGTDTKTRAESHLNASH